MNTPICKLIHISDTHFGSQFAIDGESLWRKAISRTPGLRRAAALFPHSYQSAVALAIAVRTILRDCTETGVPAVVVHTGDLTASGKQSEFSVGQTFFRHGHYLENGVIAGLLMDTEFHQLVFDIPGNHDLWQSGSPKDRASFDSFYGGEYPRIREIKNNSGSVILYGIDSNRSSKWQDRQANGEIPQGVLEVTCEELSRHRRSRAG